jgi:hypothetical protein
MEKRFHCRNTDVVSQALIGVTGAAAPVACAGPESVRDNYNSKTPAAKAAPILRALRLG